MKKLISLLLTLVLLCSLCTSACAVDTTQTDAEADEAAASVTLSLPSDWNDFSYEGYEEAMTLLFEAGVLRGYEDGTFRPDSTLTRAELCTILTRLLADEADYENLELAFPDTSAHWAASEIAYLSSLGAVNGFPDGNFYPDKTVTVGEVVTILMRLCGFDDEIVNDCSGFPHELFMQNHDQWPNNYLYFATTHFGLETAPDCNGFYEGIGSENCKRDYFCGILYQCIWEIPIPALSNQTIYETFGGTWETVADADYFVVENGVLTEYTGPEGADVVIPDNLGITAIGERAFAYSHIHAVTIPEGVTSIGAYAFYYCGLKTICFPSTLTEIGEFAFCDNLELSSVTFQSEGVSIGESAFATTVWVHTAEARALGQRFVSPAEKMALDAAAAAEK